MKHIIETTYDTVIETRLNCITPARKEKPFVHRQTVDGVYVYIRNDNSSYSKIYFSKRDVETIYREINKIESSELLLDKNMDTLPY